jgi:hypothetical protein
VYNSENGKWYRPETSFAVREVKGRGEKLPPDPGIYADTYPEAFEKIYGQALVIPPPVRAPRRESIL